MMDFLFAGIIFYFGMMLASFVGSMILSCLFSGIILMWRLNKHNILKSTNYTTYIITILFWIFVFCLITWFIHSFKKFELIWLIGSIFGFIYSFKTLNGNNMANNMSEFYEKNYNLLNVEYEKKYNKIAIDLYNKVIEKEKVLFKIIEQSGILKKYDCDLHYYNITIYMYIGNCYKMKLTQDYDFVTVIKILIIYFQLVSKNIWSNDYIEKGNKYFSIFYKETLSEFEYGGNNAIKLNINPFFYMGSYMLNKLFKISFDELANDYVETVNDISNLFLLIFDEKIIDY